MTDNPLGKQSATPENYAPEVLFGVPRETARATFLAGKTLPFRGTDIWNAWELTWLDGRGRPVVGTAKILVAADSANIVESKSLKLYLQSFADARYASAAAIADVISTDLGKIAKSHVVVTICQSAEPKAATVGSFPGICIDRSWPDFSAREVRPELLKCASETASEELYSHLLRSLCPVTGQPDSGSILVRYTGPRIDRDSLLQYLVSYRHHSDFHEACVERIFVDLKTRCDPEQLTVYARYNRRGGIDINPFRSDFEDQVENLRLWRQ